MREEKRKEKEEEERKEDVLELLLSGERVTEQIETKRGTFVIVLPLPRDVRIIEVLVAERLNGQPISAFTADTLSLIRAYATLDTIVVESPEWWRKLRSAEDCPDDTFIIGLYRGYLRFYNQTQERITKSRFGGDTKIGKVRAKAESVDNGAFSDITNR